MYSIRRYGSALIFLLLFLGFQFGKMVTYLNCKWQSEWIAQQENCGCDEHLVAIFDHDGGAADLSKEGMKEIPIEFSNCFTIQVSAMFTDFCTSCFTEYDSPLLKSAPTPAFHPPAIS